MSELDKDREIANEGRQNTLKGDDVVVPLRDRIPEKLRKKLIEDNVAEKLSRTWSQAMNDKGEFLKRQAVFVEQVDEFIEPIYTGATDWASTLHLPTILTVLKTYHARMQAALIGIDPPFTVKARQAHNVDRAALIQELVRYTLTDWVNDYAGVDAEVDKWLWDWCMAGTGILKASWLRRFSRFIDVEQFTVPDVEYQVDPESGAQVPVPVNRIEEREVIRQIKEFDGPRLERVPFEDVLVVGGEGDPQRADYVFHQSWLSSSELLSLVDQKVFDAEAVDAVIKSGKDYQSGDLAGDIKEARRLTTGTASLDQEYAIDRYKVIEAYANLDVDGSGIHSKVVLWFHPQTRQILRATYLYRISPEGTVPFFKIDFHKRAGQEHAVGLVELLYTLGREIDAIHNMKVDIGILSSMPFGYYRPSMSSVKDERMPVEPGSLVPLDNPGQDVFFPNLGNRTSFGFQEEAALMNMVERLTSVSDLSLGVIGGQGAARTATGTRALLGESNANLDVYLRRMNRGWKKAIRYVFSMLQQRLPAGLQFRLLGDDGNNYWKIIESREELAGQYDFELEANSANSNPSVQKEVANMIYQFTANPLDMQLGLISPLERYNAVVNLLKTNGIKEYSRYVRKPQGILVQYTPEEIANRVLKGFPTQLDPTQDLPGFINFVEQILSTDELLGQFSQNEISALVAKRSEAAALLDAMAQQQAQQAALMQQSQAMSGAVGPAASPAATITPADLALGPVEQ